MSTTGIEHLTPEAELELGPVGGLQELEAGPGLVLVYWGLTPQQQPGSYQGGEMMMMKSVFYWRKPEYPEETTDLRQADPRVRRRTNRPSMGESERAVD